MWQDARAQDPAQAAQIDVAYVGAGILTPDEVRANMGLAPLASPSLRGAPATKQSRSSLKKRLSKDDADDDEDEDEDDEDDDDDENDEDNNSNFDPASHPRWPAGSPGGIGGEFAPKDSGDATGTLHDAISQDAQAASGVALDAARRAGNDGGNAADWIAYDSTHVADQGKVDSDWIGPLLLGLGGAVAAGSEAFATLLARLGISSQEAAAGTGAASAESTPVTTQNPSMPVMEQASPADDTYDWRLGDFKSAQRWQNQMNSREWTLEDIDNVINSGDQFPAPNFVNPGNTATRYFDSQTGRFVVRDDVTKEILQISRENFVPNQVPIK